MRWDSEPKTQQTQKKWSFESEKKNQQKYTKKLFTDSYTTEAMWFLMSSKTAEPNTISLPQNFAA